MPHATLTVCAEWDEEARAWVATSEDVPGPVTEAATVEDLLRKLRVMVPELLELNAGRDLDDGDVPIQLVARWLELIGHEPG